MLSLLSASRHRKQKEREYQQLLQHPYHRLLTALLDYAILDNALAIGVGYRDPIAEAEAARLPLPDLHTLIEPNELLQNACEASATLKGPAREIPIWAETKDGIFLLQLITVSIYPNFLALFDSRLVSLGGTEALPQPIRYIEISPTAKGRQFVEVDLEIDRTNVFWIRIRGNRVIAPQTPVSTYCY